MSLNIWCSLICLNFFLCWQKKILNRESRYTINHIFAQGFEPEQLSSEIFIQNTIRIFLNYNSPTVSKKVSTYSEIKALLPRRDDDEKPSAVSQFSTIFHENFSLCEALFGLQMYEWQRKNSLKRKCWELEAGRMEKFDWGDLMRRSKVEMSYGESLQGSMQGAEGSL